MSTLKLAGMFLAAYVGADATLAMSQTYPNKPLRLIVPSAPGGAPDIAARLMSGELSRQLGQQVVVDNRAGTAGFIGFEMLARAAPDGYTFAHTIFNLVTNPAAYAKLPYDTFRDFQPIIQSTYVVDLLAVTPSLPVRTVRDLIEHAKANPDKLSSAVTTGPSPGALQTELFKMITGVRIVRVSYKGIQQGIGDIIGGQVHMVFDNLPSIFPHVKAGRVKPLGVTTLKRSPIAPELPTLDEAGVPGFERVGWGGYIAPSQVPRDIVSRLNSEIRTALNSPPVREKILGVGSTIVAGTPEQFGALLRNDIEKWTKVIKVAGIKAE